MRFANKVVLVTGSSRGIGRASALAFAQEGAAVVVNCQRRISAAEAVAAQIRELGPRALVVKADMGKESDILTLFERIQEEFGHLDVLVNNAAKAVFGPIERITVRHIDFTFAVNVRGPLLCLREAGRLMKGRGGSIVNISSIGGRRTMPSSTAYAAVKEGLIGLTRAAATELAPRGIRVNCLAPGVVATSSSKFLFDQNPIFRERVRAAEEIYQTEYLCQPEEIAQVVLFLASDEASAINGAVILADKGMSGVL